MGKFLIGFLEGYGSVLNLFVFPEQDDAENLRRDWMQVGDYLRSSVKVVEREVQEGARKGVKPPKEEGRG